MLADKTKTKETTIKVDRKTRDQLKQLCEGMGKDFREVVNEALRETITKLSRETVDRLNSFVDRLNKKNS